MLKKIMRRWKVSAVTVRLPLVDVTLQRDPTGGQEPATVESPSTLVATATTTEIVEEQVVTTPEMPPPVAPLSAGDFGRVKTIVAQERLSGDRLQVMKAALANAFLTVSQLGELAEMLPLSEDRVKIVRAMRDRLVDPENAFLLHRCFPISEDKKTVARLLGQG